VERQSRFLRAFEGKGSIFSTAQREIFELPLSYSQGGLLSSAKMLERLGQKLQQSIKFPAA